MARAPEIGDVVACEMRAALDKMKATQVLRAPASSAGAPVFLLVLGMQKGRCPKEAGGFLIKNDNTTLLARAGADDDDDDDEDEDERAAMMICSSKLGCY